MDHQKNKVVPIRPGVAREIGDIVEKSWNLANNRDAVANEIWSTELQAFMDAYTLKSLFYSEDWVYIIVDLIANKISSQPLKVYQQTTGEDGQVSVEEAPDHPLNELIEQPNEWQDYTQWMYNTCVELYLMGNAVVWAAPKSGQLITIPTENITMDFDQNGKVRSYLVTQASEEDGGAIDMNTAQSFDPKNIIHMRRPNPKSLLWGLSPFIPGRKSILFNRYSSDYLNAFYLKQATPGLALSLDRSVNEDVALRQLRSFESAYQGRKNMRRTLILPKGVDAKPLTHSLSDQKLLDHIKLNRETICGLLKVPKHELSLQEAGSLGSEEHKMALRNFWESTLIPGMNLVSGSLTKAFQGQLADEQGETSYFLDFDTSDVEALRDDLKKKAEIAAQMLEAGLSLNEVRTKVWEEEASTAPGADEPWVIARQRSEAINITAAPQDQAGSDSQEGSDVDEVADSPAEGEKNKLFRSEKFDRIRQRHLKQLDDEEARTIKRLAEAAIDMLIGMTDRALEVIEKSDKVQALVVRKDLPSKRVLSQRISRALREFEEDWVSATIRELSSSVELGYDQGIDLIFNAQDRQTVQTLRERDADGRRLSLEARGLDSFAQISETHTERIMRQIDIGRSKNESITDIMRRVAESLGTPGELAGKAETIARTETLTAVSVGQGAAMENAKEVIPGLKKLWLTAGDDRVRDSHTDVEQQGPIDVDKKFDNGLRYPRDIKSGDASEVINCRCTLVLLPPDEDIDLNLEV